MWFNVIKPFKSTKKSIFVSKMHGGQNNGKELNKGTEWVILNSDCDFEDQL